MSENLDAAFGQYAADYIRQLQDEIERVRDERDLARATELNRLRADLEVVREEVRGEQLLAESLRAEHDELKRTMQAEIERLRAALAIWWETTDSRVPPEVAKLAEQCFLERKRDE